ncbi:MAG: energy transducer TonB [Myxococcota bacterium]
MTLRVSIAIGLGLITTFGLFWVMQALVGITGELKEGRSAPRVEFVRLKRDRAPETKKREPPKREKPDAAPPPPQMNMAKAMNPSDAVGEIVPMVDTGVELEKATALGAGGSDRDVVPLVRVDPDYPPRAKQRRIEGYVDLEFTIGPAGTVENPRVIAARPPSVFDRAALRAVRRWRYNPKVEDGVAVSRPGIKVRLRFELQGG